MFHRAFVYPAQAVLYQINADSIENIQADHSVLRLHLLHQIDYTDDYPIFQNLAHRVIILSPDIFRLIEWTESIINTAHKREEILLYFHIPILAWSP